MIDFIPLSVIDEEVQFIGCESVCVFLTEDLA